MDDDTVEFTEADREQLRKLLNGQPVFADSAKVLAVAQRIAVRDAKLLRRLGDG
jgi:hypothetical protein